MKLPNNAGRRIASAVLAIGMLAFAALAQADPPIRAARLSYLQGPVSFAPAGDNTWVEARLNRPITIGDSLWTDNAARTELQFGVATVRLDEYTSVQLLNLDDRTIQLQLAQGRVNVHARTLRNDEVIEIATPNLAFTIRQAGDYRIEVDSRADATTVSVRSGAGEVYGEGAAFTLRANDVARSYGRDLRASEFYSLAPVDEFDRWSFDRDRRSERAFSARYVSPEVIGYADLDQYGSWDDAGGYGNVWFPRDIPREWAPYRYGHWSWIDPWGWTWVDDAPWGFAPFHYGRWAIFGARWGWVPGPINVRPVYAPALVAFIGGSNFSLSISSGPAGGGIGWFPLAPGEVYRPAYSASRDYVRNVNISNTIVNTTVINNIYNNPTNVTQVNYRNAQVPNAVTAVAPTVFARSQPVQRSMVPVTQELVRRGQVTSVAAVAPTSTGMLGGSPTTNRRPSEEIVRREVVARAAPPAPIAPVAQRVELLQRNPGRPLERSAIVANTPSPTAPTVRVVGNQAPQAIPTEMRRGTAGPPPAAQRRAGEPTRQSPQSVGAGTPSAAPPAQPAQRERDFGRPNVPPVMQSGPAATPPANVPQPAQRERDFGRPNVPPAVQSGPAATPPANVPQPAQRERDFGRPSVPPAAQPGPVAAPPANVPQPAQRERDFGRPSMPPAAQTSPVPTPPANVPQSAQRERDFGRPSVPPAAQTSPAAVPSSPAAAPPSIAPQQRERGAPDRAQGNRAGPPPTAAPSVVPQQPAPPRAAPAEPRFNNPAPPPAPIVRQRDVPQAPQAAPQPQPAPPAAAPAAAPRQAPVASPAPQRGGQESQRGRGRDNEKDDDKKEKK